jgi:hypothetical protein
LASIILTLSRFYFEKEYFALHKIVIELAAEIAYFEFSSEFLDFNTSNNNF